MATRNLSEILPVLLVLFVIVRRGQRYVMPQALKKRALVVRAVVWGALLVVVAAPTVAASPGLIGVAVAGLGAGAVLGWVGLRRTRFFYKDGVPWYAPNPYLGAVLFVLFLGRLALEFLAPGGVMSQIQGGGAAGAHVNVFAQYGSDPWTIALLVVFVGYWLFYSIGVMTQADARLRESGAAAPGI